MILVVDCNDQDYGYVIALIMVIMMVTVTTLPSILSEAVGDYDGDYDRDYDGDYHGDYDGDDDNITFHPQQGLWRLSWCHDYHDGDGDIIITFHPQQGCRWCRGYRPESPFLPGST